MVQRGISTQASGALANKDKTFQGQKFDDDLGLNYYSFKYRNHDPQIGRFTEIDPLSDKYEYNSTYAFSENKVTAHVELEGLEAQLVINRAWEELKANFQHIADVLNPFNVGVGASVEVSDAKGKVSTEYSGKVTVQSNTSPFTEHLMRTNSTENGPQLVKVEASTERKVETKVADVSLGVVKVDAKASVNSKGEVSTSKSAEVKTPRGTIGMEIQNKQDGNKTANVSYSLSGGKVTVGVDAQNGKVKAVGVEAKYEKEVKNAKVTVFSFFNYGNR